VTDIHIGWKENYVLHPVLHLPFGLGVLKHRVPLVRRPIFLPKKNKTKNCDGFLLMWSNFKFEVGMSDCLCRPTGSTSFRAQARGLIT